MITYNRGQWVEDESMPDEYRYSSDKGLTYAGYDPSPNWSVGIEDAFQVHIHWVADENFESAKYRYFAHVSTFAFGECVLIPDFPSLLMFLKEIAPLFHDAREQELYKMQVEEHEWRAKDRRSETGEKGFCAHL